MPKRKLEDDYSGPPIQHFSLAPHQALMRSGYGPLVRPSGHGGLTLLTSPDGRPVIRTAHRDLKPNEVNFILR